MNRTLLVGLASLLVLTGCADAPESEGPGPAAQPPAPRTPPEQAPDAEDDVAEQVPAQLDFALPELTGGQVVGAELAGRHVALWFWTPW